MTAGLLQFTSGAALAADGVGDMPTVTLTGAHRTAPRQAFLATAHVHAGVFDRAG